MTFDHCCLCRAVVDGQDGGAAGYGPAKYNGSESGCEQLGTLWFSPGFQFRWRLPVPLAITHYPTITAPCGTTPHHVLVAALS